VKLYSGRKSTAVFILFSLLAVILRFFSFFPSVIDHDESTYLEIARMLLAGKTLYVDMIDIKPPGTFLILAGFQWVFGYSVIVIRLMVAIWIGLTAFILYRTSGLIIKNERVSIASGVVYIFFISTWSFYGISITPEIFFNLFTISSLYVLLKNDNRIRYFWAGLLAGIGFIIKYLVIFDFAAFVIFLVYSSVRNQKSAIRNQILPIFLAGTGFLLPFGITNLWYCLNGHFDALVNIVYLAPSKYPAAFDAWKMLKFMLDFHLRFLPMFFLFYYVLITKKWRNEELRNTRRLGILWSVLALVAVLIAGKAFGHYTIQLMLPVSLVAGIFFHPELTMRFKMKGLFQRKTGLVIMIILILSVSAMKLEYVFKKDVPREIAAYLEPRLKPGDVIYTGNYHHIIYYLLKKDSPTKYVHRSLLLGDHHIKALDINVDEEFRHIMALRPVYIIVQEDYPNGMMRDFIHENYSVEKEFDGEVYLYKLK
jgi:4-amino-4-deoxy-L-arabinose transferase-like glycosyltransferase